MKLTSRIKYGKLTSEIKYGEILTSKIKYELTLTCTRQWNIACMGYGAWHRDDWNDGSSDSTSLSRSCLDHHQVPLVQFIKKKIKEEKNEYHKINETK